MKKTVTGGKKIIGIVTGVLLIIAATSAVIFFVTNNKEDENKQDPVPSFVEDPVDSDGRGIILNEKNYEKVLQNITDKVDEGYFETCMTNEWEFNNGISDVRKVYIKNEVTNSRMFYFDLYSDNDDVIFSSPFLTVGSEMPQFELSKIPEKGIHEGKIIYHLVDDNKEEVSKVAVAVTIKIN